MSRYSIKQGITDLVIVDDSVANGLPSIVVSLVPHKIGTDYADCIGTLKRLLSQPAQFEVTQRLMSEEEFRQVQELYGKRESIESQLRKVAVDKAIEVRIADFPKPKLAVAAIRGVLSQLMDDLAHNGNAIRKLGVEPFAIDKPVAEAVEAALAVFLEPGAAE